MVLPFSYFANAIRSAALLAFAVLSICTAVPVSAGAPCRVVVVRSARLQPHLEVVRGIRAACECTVREVTLRDEDGPEKVLAKSPNVIITVGTSELTKLKEIRSVPLIYAMSIPSEALRCHAANISGVSMDISPASHLAAMQELFRDRKRVGVIYDPVNTGAFLEEAVKAARAAGLELISQQVHDASSVPAALSAMRGRIDIFWMLPDPTVVTPENIDLLLRYSFQEAVPIFTFSRKYVDMGAVASLDFDPYDIGVQVGELVNRLKTGSGPVLEYARTSHLIVNRNVARKMGLAITDDIMRRVKGSD